jgi:hypothetical protein
MGSKPNSSTASKRQNGGKSICICDRAVQFLETLATVQKNLDNEYQGIPKEVKKKDLDDPRPQNHRNVQRAITSADDDAIDNTQDNVHQEKLNNTPHPPQPVLDEDHGPSVSDSPTSEV